MPVLPQELVEHILNYLSNDFQTIKTCSLVCHAWRVPTQKFLFAKLQLSNRPSIVGGSFPSLMFTIFDRFPHLTDYVRDLVIAERKRPPGGGEVEDDWTSVYDDPFLAGILTKLSRLKKVSLLSSERGLFSRFSGSSWLDLSEDLTSPLTSILNYDGLTHLELTSIWDIPISFITSSPALKSLTLSSVEFEPYNLSQLPPHHQRASPQTLNFSVGAAQLSFLIELLDHPNSPIDLSHVEVLNLETDDNSLVNRFCALLPPSTALHRLAVATWNPEGPIEPLYLIPFTNLHILHWSANLMEAESSWGFALLWLISSLNLFYQSQSQPQSQSQSQSQSPSQSEIAPESQASSSNNKAYPLNHLIIEVAGNQEDLVRHSEPAEWTALDDFLHQQPPNHHHHHHHQGRGQEQDQDQEQEQQSGSAFVDSLVTLHLEISVWDDVSPDGVPAVDYLALAQMYERKLPKLIASRKLRVAFN